MINNHLIESVDLSKNIELLSLELYGNKLKSIDISKNIKLRANTSNLKNMETLKCVKVDSGWLQAQQGNIDYYSPFGDANLTTSNCPSD